MACKALCTPWCRWFDCDFFNVFIEGWILEVQNHMSSKRESFVLSPSTRKACPWCTSKRDSTVIIDFIKLNTSVLNNVRRLLISCDTSSVKLISNCKRWITRFNDTIYSTWWYNQLFRSVFTRCICSCCYDGTTCWWTFEGVNTICPVNWNFLTIYRYLNSWSCICTNSNIFITSFNRSWYILSRCFCCRCRRYSRNRTTWTNAWFFCFRRISCLSSLRSRCLCSFRSRGRRCTCCFWCCCSLWCSALRSCCRRCWCRRRFNSNWCFSTCCSCCSCCRRCLCDCSSLD